MRKIRINFFWPIVVFAFAVLLFGFVSVSGQTRITVHVSPETIIENDRISLGSISTISGESNSSARLKLISLGYAPHVGMTREISRG